MALSRTSSRTTAFVSTARMPLADVLSDGLLNITPARDRWPGPEQCVMNVLRGVAARPADYDFVILFVPLQHGPGAYTEFLTNLSGYGNLALSRQLRFCDRHGSTLCNQGNVSTITRRRTGIGRPRRRKGDKYFQTREPPDSQRPPRIVGPIHHRSNGQPVIGRCQRSLHGLGILSANDHTASYLLRRPVWERAVQLAQKREVRDSAPAMSVGSVQRDQGCQAALNIGSPIVVSSSRAKALRTMPDPPKA